MRRTIAAGAALGLLWVSGCTTVEEAAYRFHKDVVREGSAGEGILTVPLDPDVYAATRPEFPDVRILDSTDAEVPFVLEQATRSRTRTFREPCDSELESLRVQDDHVLEIVIKLGEKAPHASGLTVVTPLSDYEHRVRVFEAEGNGAWKLLIDSGLIFDYSRYMDVRNRDLTLPANRSRRFKLEIHQGLERLESPFLGLVKELKNGSSERQLEFRELMRRPFRIDRVEAWRTVERSAAEEPDRMPYRVSVEAVDRDPEQKVTLVRVRSRREPITRLRIRTPSRNFSRVVRVEVPVEPAHDGRHREIGRGTIHRFQLGDFLDERLDVEFPETRVESYRIVIEDGDSPPLDISTADAEGNLYQLALVAGAGAKYRVVYGSPDAAAPHYDVATVLASLRPKQQAATGGLGEEVIDRRSPRPRPWPGLLSGRMALMLALALMVLVLAWALFRAGKAIETLPKVVG